MQILGNFVIASTLWQNLFVTCLLMGLGFSFPITISLGVCFGHLTCFFGHPTTKVKGLKCLSPVHYKKNSDSSVRSTRSHFFDIFSRFFFLVLHLLPSLCSSFQFRLLLCGSSSSLLPHLRGSWFMLVLLLRWFIFSQVSYSSFHVLLDSLFLLLVV